MNQERLMKVLLSPHVSEKTARVAETQRQFVFKVMNDANKREIARAVEQLFDVQVAGVQVVNLSGKKKRFGRMEGRRKDWKKAYVTLKEGHDIEFATS